MSYTGEKRNAYMREWNKRQNNPETRTTVELPRERFLRLKNSGLCGMCGAPRTNYKELCDECTAARNIRQARYTHKCKAEKKCSRCAAPTDGQFNLCDTCRHAVSIYRKTLRKDLKLEAFQKYGGPVCVCCGETHELLLTLDHINNDGAEHRRSLGYKKAAFYEWLRKNNYPPGYQVLCWNCNMGKHLNGGVCPHKEKENA